MSYFHEYDVYSDCHRPQYVQQCLLILAIEAWTAMSQFYYSKQLKMCTVIVFLMTNLCVRLWLITQTQYVCYDYDNGNDDYKSNYASLSLPFFWKEIATVLVTGVIFLLAIKDNFKELRKRHCWILPDFIACVLYFAIYCPILPLNRYFISPINNKLSQLADWCGMSPKISKMGAISMQTINSLHLNPHNSETTPKVDEIPSNI